MKSDENIKQIREKIIYLGYSNHPTNTNQEPKPIPAHVRKSNLTETHLKFVPNNQRTRNQKPLRRLTPVHHQTRKAKAQQILNSTIITQQNQTNWRVPSQAGKGSYKVTINEQQLKCTCDDFDLHNAKCKHILAIQLILQEEQGIKQEPMQTPKKQSYPQNWKAYDQAKTNEFNLFLSLINELLTYITKESKPKTGRKPYSIKTQILSLCTKIYYNTDLRRATSVLKTLKNQFQLNKIPSFKTIDNFYKNPELSKLLDTLILASALPLAQIEETGATDATGFSTSQFASWNEYKHGKFKGKERIWIKAHASTLCKTNAFLAVEITDKDTADPTMFKEVTDKRTKLFNIRDWTADKAYLSKDILKFLDQMDYNPFIPFKSNSQRSSGTTPQIWKKMFDHFHKNHEDYLKHYHQRSNIESSFAMLKKRFNNHVSTKSIETQTVEVKIKVLCMNLSILIQELFEQDINIDFLSCAKTAQSCAKTE